MMESVSLSREELVRFSRHLTLDEVGVAGQERLKKGRVLCVGAGGLGSPAALYLAAAGVGTIGLVEFDVVDVTNLQRQVLYTTADVGRPKLQVAAERIRVFHERQKQELGGFTYTEPDGTVLGQAWWLLQHPSEVHRPTLAVCLGTLALLLVGARLWPTGPVPLIGMLAATLAVAAAGLSDDGVAVVGSLPFALPSFGLPALSSPGSSLGSTLGSWALLTTALEAYLSQVRRTLEPHRAQRAAPTVLLTAPPGSAAAAGRRPGRGRLRGRPAGRGAAGGSRHRLPRQARSGERAVGGPPRDHGRARVARRAGGRRRR